MMKGRQAALERLREEQSKTLIPGLPPLESCRTTLKLALEHVDEEEGNAVLDGEYLREGVFKYEKTVEQKRFAKTREVIRRCEPGYYEDPVYLAMLARQAASIEMTVDEWTTGSPTTDCKDSWCRNILLGTSGSLDFNASARIFRETGCSTVVVYSGLIYFMYQCAKAVVLSWKQADPGKAAVAFSPGRKATLQTLKHDRHPLDLITGTLRAYLTTGHPRAGQSIPPPDQFHPPLSLLTSFNERFVIGHEYGHVLLAQESGLSESFPGLQGEHAADVFGMLACVSGASSFDGVAPNVALQGPLFALSCLEILRRAKSVLTSGREKPDRGSLTHPPLRTRAEVVEREYRRAVGLPLSVSLSGSMWQPISYGLDDEGGPNDNVWKAWSPTQSLAVLWDMAKPALREDHDKGLKLAPLWLHSS
jgi:hypothetical protein